MEEAIAVEVSQALRHLEKDAFDLGLGQLAARFLGSGVDLQ